MREQGSFAEPARPPLELWGGIECTIARIGDRYRDQVTETGHRDRLGDLDQLASLGIKVLRYPALWESIAPEQPGSSDLSWHDARLTRLRDLGLRPILGLVHHGSGPRYTSLLDPAFPRLLARHAEAVARRFPWVNRFTPVNEPLTTARFAALYGHWYPHARDYGAFLRAVVIQCRATLLAMRAIRRVTPDAELVQTEDLGRTFSTPKLAYQADHENERRWLTYDLLFGRVDRAHPWRRILRDHGVPARWLDELLDGEARPDILGVNHYLTGERFLDERLERYPPHLAGGNGRDSYADGEAVRVPLPPGSVGPAPRLREVWDRYRAPVAVTEVHHGCTRDEQLRWLHEVWRAAHKVRSEGADIRAVTIWAMFGAVDWNSLLTREAGVYEPGAFDARGPAPRPTALARAASELVAGRSIDHPVLDGLGWWRRDSRFYAPPAKTAVARRPARAVCVVGPDGPTRQAFLGAAEQRGLALKVVDRGRSADPSEDPIWAVLDLRLDLSRTRPAPDLALARRCQEDGLPYVLVGTEPEVERWSGQVAVACPRALLVASGEPFGPAEPDDVIVPMLRALSSGLPTDRGSGGLLAPTYLPDLAHVVLDLLIDGEQGLWRLSSGRLGPTELAQALAQRIGLGRSGPRLPVTRAQTRTEERPLLPPLSSALDRFFADCAFEWRQRARPARVAAE